MQGAVRIILCSFIVALSGCTAVCLRDSDCIGASVCLQDRCVLLTPRDGGGTAAVATRTPTPSPSSSPPPAPAPAPAPAIGDAGSGDFGSAATGDVGSAATATRGFLDAAADGATPASGP